MASADHLIAWRIPCTPGRLRLLAGAHGGTPQCHSRSAHGRYCAHPQVNSQDVRRAGMPRGARCGHTTSRGHAWGRQQVDVRECSVAHTCCGKHTTVHHQVMEPHVMYSHRVFTVQQIIACACVCSSLAWLSQRSSVAIATQCGAGNIQNHFWPHSQKPGSPTRTPLPASHPEGYGTNHPRLLTRAYTQGAGRGDTHWAPLWYTATVVHRVHASTSLRLSKPRRAVGHPQHQEGGVPV